MGRSRFIDLMAKSLAKTATAKELAELEVFLKQFPKYGQLYKVTNALKINDTSPDDIKTPVEKIEQLWNHINNNKEAEQGLPIKVKPLFKWQWAAAAALLIGVLGGVLYFGDIKPGQVINIATYKVQVPYGEMRQVVMPDGTKITLNAGSTLFYPGSFARKTREVTLVGEGLFRVVKNPDKPFLVRTKNLTVTVLGTVFNVKAYNNDSTTETTLLSGKVQVDLNNNPEKKIILLPHEKLIVANNQPNVSEKDQPGKNSQVEYLVTSLLQVRPEEIKETAWLDKRIIFTNETFEDVAKQIERKYNVQLIFGDEKLKSEQISGLLDKEPLPAALQLIEMTTPFNYKISGRLVYLSHKLKNN